MDEIAHQNSCPFCVLVANSVAAKLERDTAGKIILDAEARRLFTAHWYLSPFVYYHEDYGHGYQLFLRPNIREIDNNTTDVDKDLHMHPSWPFAVRSFNGKPRGGRIVPQEHLSYDWIRSTMGQCDRFTEMPLQDFIHPLRIIDVQEMCVTVLPPESNYVCLSYVWGNAETLKLNKHTRDFLRSPGSMTALGSQLPQTMQDAIVLVRKVGQRYLWIDALCIFQDDSIDLAQQLDQMGEIYLHSYFTIFAISGIDASHGLPGVRPRSRNLRQTVQKIGDLTVASSLPWTEEEHIVQGGAWGSRGWTFQERFRAQRGLFIGNKGMIINCEHTYSPEDEHCFHGRKNAQFISRGTQIFFAGQHKQCVPRIRMEQTPFDLFAILVSEYSARKLTYQSDAENACLALFDYLELQLGGGIIHGLPETEFDAALLWPPIGSSIRSVNPITKKPLFPSWSWLGWDGHVAWVWTLDRDTFLTTSTSPLEWYDVSAASLKLSLILPCYGLEAETASESLWFKSEIFCVPKSIYVDVLLTVLHKCMRDYLGLRAYCAQVHCDRLDWVSKYEIYWDKDRLGSRLML